MEAGQANGTGHTRGAMEIRAPVGNYMRPQARGSAQPGPPGCADLATGGRPQAVTKKKAVWAVCRGDQVATNTNIQLAGVVCTQTMTVAFFRRACVEGRDRKSNMVKSD